MVSTFTDEEIAQLVEIVKKYPPDPAYDEEEKYLDAKLPPMEFKARCAYDILESLGELPEELKRK